MKQLIVILCMGLCFHAYTVKAQWVVTDPMNLAQGIVNTTKQIIETSTTAQNMISNCAPVKAV